MERKNDTQYLGRLQITTASMEFVLLEGGDQGVYIYGAFNATTIELEVKIHRTSKTI